MNTAWRRSCDGTWWKNHKGRTLCVDPSLGRGLGNEWQVTAIEEGQLTGVAEGNSPSMREAKAEALAASRAYDRV
jgi:hypothetical protein